MLGHALAALLLGACASSGAGGAPGALGGPREDLVVVTQFDRLGAVAVSRRHVFAAGPAGLAIYDRLFDRWLVPLSIGDGYPRDRVTFLAADPAGEGVWIGAAGSVTHFAPTIGQASRATIPGTADAILFDARDPAAGAYVRAGGGWWLVSSTGFARPLLNPAADLPPAAARIVPPTLEELYEDYPTLRGFERLLTRDEQLRTWPVSDAARAPERGEVWLATLGGGLYQVDPVFNRAEQFPFGLLDAGAGALARAADGVWVGSAGAGGFLRGGLTFAGDELQEWRWVEGPASRPFRGARVLALAVRGPIAWAGTERGLVRLDLASPESATRLDAGDRLPGDRVLAVAATSDGAWVATDRGVVRVQELPDGHLDVSEPMASGTPVRALLVTGDTLWVGSDAGLLLLPPGGDRLVRATTADPERRLGRRIRGLASSDSVVAIATDAEVLRLVLPRGTLLPPLPGVSSATLGGIRAVAMDGEALWVAGPRGALQVDRRSGASRLFSVGGDLPGEVNDVLLTERYVWIATERGLARLARLPGGLVR